MFPNTLTLTAGSPTATVTAVARNRSGRVVSGVTIYFVSSDPSIATVNKTTGVVTRVASGTVIITGQLTDPAGGGGLINRADTFNRADALVLGSPSDGGSAWTLRGGGGGAIGLQTNQVYEVGGGTMYPGDPDGGTLATLTCSPNGTLAVDRVGGLSGGCGLVLRYVNATNFWSVQISGNYIYVWKLVGGVKTTLVSDYLSGNYPIDSAPVTLQVQLTASNFVVKTVKAGVTATEYTLPAADADWAASASAVEHGIILRDTTVRIDNFSFVGA